MPGLFASSAGDVAVLLAVDLSLVLGRSRVRGRGLAPSRLSLHAAGKEGKRSRGMTVAWIRDRALTLAMMAMFLLFLAGQLVTGFYEYNATQAEHGQARVDRRRLPRDGPPMGGALRELGERVPPDGRVRARDDVASFRRVRRSPGGPNVTELVDADPRDFADVPGVPWPVKRGGWILRIYENSLGLAFVLLFLMAWVGHAAAASRSSRQTR